LLGLRASGKSLVGRLLAQQFDRPFWDSDVQLAARLGAEKSAGEHLQAFGEARFRREEWQTLFELLERPELSVVASGGGAVASPFSRELLGRRSTGVYLRTGLDVLRARAEASDEFRPDLYRGGTKLDLEQQLTIREPLYLQLASLVIDTDSAKADEIALSLADQLQSRGLV
jgi:shikimate kinase